MAGNKFGSTQCSDWHVCTETQTQKAGRLVLQPQKNSAASDGNTHNPHPSMGKEIQPRFNEPLVSLWTFPSSPPCQGTTSGSPGSCSHPCLCLGRCLLSPQPGWGRAEALGSSAAPSPPFLLQHRDLLVTPTRSTRGRSPDVSSDCC